MHRMVVGILVLVLGISVVAAADNDQDKLPPTPEQQYKALLKEYQRDAFENYVKAFREAKTPQDPTQLTSGWQKDTVARGCHCTPS